MTERKSGMFGILKGVFRLRKNNCEDIVYRAEIIVSDYVSHKRGEIISRYGKKKHCFRNLCLGLICMLLLFFCIPGFELK